MSQKDAYVQKINAQLDEWKAKLDVVKAKAKNKGADSRIDYEKKADELDEKLAALREKRDELKKSAEDNWDQIRQKAEKQMEDVKSTLASLTS